MKSKQIAEYIKRNGLSGDFIDSLMKGYAQYGSFTPKQKKCLEENIEKDKAIKEKFDRIKTNDPEKFEESEFLKNIYTFYSERKFLTRKQTAALMNMD